MSGSKSKVALSITAALTVMIAASGADAGRTISARNDLRVVARDHAPRSAPLVVADDAGVRPGAKAHTPEGVKQIYVVQLADSPVATYRGGISGYARTEMRPGRARSNATPRGLLDTRSAESVAYAGYLGSKQAEVKQRLEQRVGHTLRTVYSYKY